MNQRENEQMVEKVVVLMDHEGLTLEQALGVVAERHSLDAGDRQVIEDLYNETMSGEEQDW